MFLELGGHMRTPFFSRHPHPRHSVGLEYVVGHPYDPFQARQYMPVPSMVFLWYVQSRPSTLGPELEDCSIAVTCLDEKCTRMAVPRVSLGTYTLHILKHPGSSLFTGVSTWAPWLVAQPNQPAPFQPLAPARP